MTSAPLRLGVFEDSGQEYLFDGNESLITIARPGRGKTQAHVIRNLAYLDAPVVVLDVKPEILDATIWGRQKIGGVYAFVPGGPAEETIHFNPLDMVPADPVAADTAIRRLIPLLMVPTEARDAKGFWEGRAAQFLHAAIYDVCLHGNGNRNMAAVVDWFSPTPRQLAERIIALQESGVRSLVRVGNQMETQDEETRANLFDTVLRHIEVWGSAQIEAVTAKTNFDFSLLLEENISLFICVTPEELVAYRSIIRAFLGQLFQTLRNAKDRQDQPPVTFFLDEFPQLGYMPEIEQMLALGRQAGLRLWLFAQTRGQIKAAYGDADRLLDMMAARCFIEPTGDLAAAIAKELPRTRDFYSGKEHTLATAADLAGPEFKDKVIVLEGGKPPAKLVALKAFEDPEARRRLKMDED
jgi:type IV secretory pathway TraG/TraD family ATPase VirD4